MKKRIIEDFIGPSQEIISAFKILATPTIDETSGKLCAMDSSIKPIWRGMKCRGFAFTVKCNMVIT